MTTDFFIKYFPLPDFLKMPAVGIDISDRTVRFVELVNKDGEKRLGSYGRVDLPQGVVVGGRINDKQKLANVLKEIKGRFRSRFVRVSLIEKNSYVFRTNVSFGKNMSEDEKRAILKFKLEENVPLKPEAVVFDFDVLKGGDVVVCALPKVIVDEFVEVFNMAGLTPLSFEVESQAVARASVPQDNKNAIMIVDFRGSRVSISIVSEGVVQLTSTVDLSADDLTESIESHLGVSKEKAEQMKKEKGFTKIDADDNLFSVMINTASVLKDEINKFLLYWHSHKDNQVNGKIKSRVQKILLSGSGSSIRGLDLYLSSGIGLPVERVDVWTNLFDLNDYTPEMNFLTSLEYAPAVGLAMREK